MKRTLCGDILIFTNVVFLLFVAILFGYHKEYVKTRDSQVDKNTDWTFLGAMIFLIINIGIWYYL